MERLQVGICEDDSQERERLLTRVNASAERVEAETFGSAEELLAAFYPGKFDLLILDIYMNGMTGIDALEKIREKDTRVVAAIATTSKDFALESYRLRAARYLEKPVRADEIEELMRYVIMKKESEPHFECEMGGMQVRIPFDRILFVEQKGKNLCIHLDDGDEKTVRGTLDETEQRFPENCFFRCHKSYLVNLAKIRDIDRELMTFVMGDGQQVHIARRSFYAAKRAYEQYLFHAAGGEEA